MLKNMISEELIVLNVEASDWKDAVRKAACPLVNQGKIKESYVDGIIRAVHEIGPYFVLTKHVALAHSRPEDGVIEGAIGIATLKTPIEFGNEDNDPVKYIFTLSAIDNNAHLSALSDLAGLLEQQEFYEFLDKAKSAEEVMNYINAM
ncbi:PTS sugar transporter subunit IIA [Anaerorhabdus furcosa]|uniref:Ascorbate-specific PTS system EIIA component n=1 Tax=Anaerorhabdus furcosa TaxID=118967 RepID=A0A1T4MMT2_9FIRM|nr:PTS sugar transporter subunit IIA [Anaerorhabdus furcosa]SJZ68084.1 PTS system, ascorbate-specific IIA component [Anaerorhabdus furcosa]